MAGWWSCKDAKSSNRSPWHMPYVPMVRSISSSRKVNTCDLIRIWHHMHHSQGKDGSIFHVRTFSYDMYDQVVRYHLHKCLTWHVKKHKSMCNHPWKQNQKIISFLISPPPLLGSHELNAKHYARSTCHIDLLTKQNCMSWTHSSTLDRSQHYKQMVKLRRNVFSSLQSWSLICSKIFWSGLTIFEVLILQPALSQVLTKGTSVCPGLSTPCILGLNSSHPRNDKESS